MCDVYAPVLAKIDFLLCQLFSMQYVSGMLEADALTFQSTISISHCKLTRYIPAPEYIDYQPPV